MKLISHIAPRSALQPRPKHNENCCSCISASGQWDRLLAVHVHAAGRQYIQFKIHVTRKTSTNYKFKFDEIRLLWPNFNFLHMRVGVARRCKVQSDEMRLSGGSGGHVRVRPWQKYPDIFTGYLGEFWQE